MIISSQSGAFLLYGLDAVMDEEGTADISVNRISVSNKEKILKVWDENKSVILKRVQNSQMWAFCAQHYKLKVSSRRDSS